MISRAAAEVTLPLLENVLDKLLAAHTQAQVLSSSALMACFEPYWQATANTAGMISVIQDSFPDLSTPSPEIPDYPVPPLPSAIPPESDVRASALTVGDTAPIVGDLRNADILLRQIDEKLKAPGALDSTKAQLFVDKLWESLASIQSTIHKIRGLQHSVER